jgi:hypothetical protein
MLDKNFGGKVRGQGDKGQRQVRNSYCKNSKSHAKFLAAVHGWHHFFLDSILTVPRRTLFLNKKQAGHVIHFFK